MRNRSTGRQVMLVLAPMLLALTACAGPATTAAPSAKQQPAAESPVQRAVQELLANQAAGRLRTVSGVGYVLAPIVVPLENGEVSLLPSAPYLESALARIQRQWVAGRRQPLPFEAFQRAFTLLTAHRLAVGRDGGEALVRFAKTDDKGRFTFEQIPEGRWLLVADMSSPVSTLLWTVPVQLGAQNPPPILLTEGSLLLEARKPEQATPAP